MNTLALQLQSLSKLKIYTAVRSIVLRKMGNDEISPERAMRIIKETKNDIVQLKTALEGVEYCTRISKKYEELEELADLLERETLEQYDRVLSKMSEQFMEKNDLSRVDDMLAKMDACDTRKKKEELLKKMQETHPDEFRTAVNAVIQSHQ